MTWLRDKAGARWRQRGTILCATPSAPCNNIPSLGRPRNDLSPPGIRSWRVSGFPRWLIFYTVDERDHLVIYRLRQGTMNLVVLKMES